MSAAASLTLFRNLAWELRRTFRDLAMAADQSLKPLAITVGDRALLEMLARQDDAISLSELARTHSVSRQHVQQALRRLPDPEWIEVVPDRNDARTMNVRLSAKGRAFWRRVEEVEDGAFRELAEAQDLGELERTIAFLRRLRVGIARSQEP